MSPTMLIASESRENVHHFGMSPIATVLFVEVIEFHPMIYIKEIQVIGFHPMHTSFIIIVDFKARLIQIRMGCHHQCGDHLKVHRKGFI